MPGNERFVDSQNRGVKKIRSVEEVEMELSLPRIR
jgi:hypothetical protein